MKSRSEHSAGGVVVRTQGGVVEVVMASRRTRRGDLAWGLPKGLVEGGERSEDAAVREVQEETGLVAEIRSTLGEISYFFVWDGERVRKRVEFFLMDAVGGDISNHDFEMEDVEWVPLAQAVHIASYRSEQEVLCRAAEALGASA